MTDLFPVKQGDNILHNFTDVVTGRSFVTLYGGVTRVTGGATYVLSGTTIDSAIDVFSAPFQYYVTIADGQVAGTALDLDFDVTVNRPVQVEGTAICNVSFGQYAFGAGDDGQYTLTAIFRKYSGVTETDLATAVTDAKDPSDTIKQGRREALPLTIAKTSFKVGDIMRLTLQLKFLATCGATKKFFIAHEPTNKDTTPVLPNDVDSTLILKVPFIVQE